MLPLETINKYYPIASEFVGLYSHARILWAAFRPASAARRASLALRAGRSGWEVLKRLNKVRNTQPKASSIPVRVLGYMSIFDRIFLNCLRPHAVLKCCSRAKASYLFSKSSLYHKTKGIRDLVDFTSPELCSLSLFSKFFVQPVYVLSSFRLLKT